MPEHPENRRSLRYHIRTASPPLCRQCHGFLSFFADPSSLSPLGDLIRGESVAPTRCRRARVRSTQRAARLGVSLGSIGLCATFFAASASGGICASIQVVEVLASLTQCIINCAKDPVPNYYTCRANCYNSASAYFSSVGTGAVPAIQPPLDPSDVDVELLLDAMREVEELQHLLERWVDPMDPVSRLEEFFRADYWDDDVFVRAQFVDTYFVASAKDLIALSRSSAPDLRDAIDEMLVQLALDDEVLDRASTVGKVGTLALALRVAGPDDRRFIREAMQWYGLGPEVAAFNAELGPRERTPAVDEPQE